MSPRSLSILGGLFLAAVSASFGAPVLSAGRAGSADVSAADTPAASWIEPESDSLPGAEEAQFARSEGGVYRRVDREPVSVVSEPTILLLLGLGVAGLAARRQLME